MTDIRLLMKEGILRRYRRLFLFILLICSLFLLFLLTDLIFPCKVSVDYSTVIADADSTIMKAYLNRDDKWRLYTRLDEITPDLKKAILFKEDKYFQYHIGVNPVSVVRAMMNNLSSGRRTSGASTISMQVARLLEPKRRTYLNKLVEIFRAIQLEWHYTKNEILQLYLNLVPFGGNIEGVKAASVIYLNKMPDQLSIGEIATLSIIPNRPNTLRPGENNEILKRERDKWLNRYLKAGLFPEQDILDAIEEPLKASRHELPDHAHHICRRLHDQEKGKHTIYSTIHLEMQLKTEALVKEHINRWYFRNIKNAAALVIDNKTGSVIAYVGSADFFNSEDAGQVDGIRAVRSPGSTLKPLVYGLAFDHGLVTPKSVISDVPVYYSGYEPENYDGKYHGLVNVEYALSNSLNVPAVKLMNELNAGTVIEALIKAGFRQIKNDRDRLGLSVALGGCGVTLEELTYLYHTLSNKGILKEIRLIKPDNPFQQEGEKKEQNIRNKQNGRNKKKKQGTHPDDHACTGRILSEEAAFMVTDILCKVTRPDLPTEWQNSANLPRVAWKTGTSYGRRDAWSIGYNRNYTIGVWVGNFSGTGVPELSGADAAAPLLFRIFNALDYGSEENWYEVPEGLKSRIVCSVSGQPYSDFCNDLVIDYYIPSVSSSKPCRHMKEVFISPDSSVSYCMTCRPEFGYIKALYPNYAPEVIAYFEENNINYQKIPPHNSECERIFSGTAPVITSPLNGAEYYVDETDSMQIALSCNASNDVEKVFWYINKRYFKSALPNEKTFFSPREGRIEISCSDDRGRNTDIQILVKKISF
ncbi:MAG: penicillin-binding protein 1C [Bacteroidales bacterium]|nr:penicillin-binding protein 1C [Bacteroidales bacterium]